MLSERKAFYNDVILCCPEDSARFPVRFKGYSNYQSCLKGLSRCNLVHFSLTVS